MSNLAESIATYIPFPNIAFRTAIYFGNLSIKQYEKEYVLDSSSGFLLRRAKEQLELAQAVLEHRFPLDWKKADSLYQSWKRFEKYYYNL
ncbi:MAG: hypothetical protein HYX24_03790 [Candidatus Aenigmarchaeota archaeon]|nr:hypothetical protein [Candidatus Aenigmarchaeota archaeon]